MMRTKLVPVLLAVGALLLSGCAAAEEPSAEVLEEAPAQDSGNEESTSAGGEEDSYIVRLTPVAKIKDAVNIEVNGLDGRVTLPRSSAESSIMDCLHLLPAASGDGETLTLIYSDGVEELCEWN